MDCNYLLCNKGNRSTSTMGLMAGWLAKNTTKLKFMYVPDKILNIWLSAAFD